MRILPGNPDPKARRPRQHTFLPGDPSPEGKFGAGREDFSAACEVRILALSRDAGKAYREAGGVFSKGLFICIYTYCVNIYTVFLGRKLFFDVFLLKM